MEPLSATQLLCTEMIGCLQVMEYAKKVTVPLVVIEAVNKRLLALAAKLEGMQ